MNYISKSSQFLFKLPDGVDSFKGKINIAQTPSNFFISPVNVNQEYFKLCEKMMEFYENEELSLDSKVESDYKLSANQPVAVCTKKLWIRGIFISFIPTESSRLKVLLPDTGDVMSIDFPNNVRLLSEEFLEFCPFISFPARLGLAHKPPDASNWSSECIAAFRALQDVPLNVKLLHHCGGFDTISGTFSVELYLTPLSVQKFCTALTSATCKNASTSSHADTPLEQSLSSLLLRHKLAVFPSDALTWKFGGKRFFSRIHATAKPRITLTPDSISLNSSLDREIIVGFEKNRSFPPINDVILQQNEVTKTEVEKESALLGIDTSPLVLPEVHQSSDNSDSNNNTNDNKNHGGNDESNTSNIPLTQPILASQNVIAQREEILMLQSQTNASGQLPVNNTEGNPMQSVVIQQRIMSNQQPIMYQHPQKHQHPIMQPHPAHPFISVPPLQHAFMPAHQPMVFGPTNRQMVAQNSMFFLPPSAQHHGQFSHTVHPLTLTPPIGMHNLQANPVHSIPIGQQIMPNNANFVNQYSLF